MKRRSGVPFYLMYGPEQDLRKFFFTYSLSILCHLIFFAVVMFAPDRMPERKFTPDVINVSMVSLPTDAPSAKTAAPVDRKEAASETVKPEVSTRPEAPASKKVSVPAKPKKAKTSLKKKTFKSSRVVKSAIERIEKTVEDTAPSPLEEALDRLEKEVGKTEVDRLKGTGDSAKKNEAGVALPGSGPGIKKILEVIDIYRVEIAYKVQKNWAFSGQLAGDTSRLQASLVFKVMPSGEIRDVFFTDRSGNEFLDDSAYKAIVKSNPVDPHPAGVKKPYINVGLRFTPEGVR